MKGLGGMADMARMMKTARDMQGRVEDMQRSLETLTVEGTAGGGLVKATASAKGELRGLSIDASLFRPEDREVVEDLIVAAVRDAQLRAADLAQQQMTKITSELGLPADLKMPF